MDRAMAQQPLGAAALPLPLQHQSDVRQTEGQLPAIHAAITLLSPFHLPGT